MNQINKFKRRPRLCLSCPPMQLLTRQRAVLEATHHQDHLVERSTSVEHCHQRPAGASLILTAGRKVIQLCHLSKTVNRQINLAYKDLQELETIQPPSLKIRRDKNRCHLTRTLPRQTQPLSTRWSMLSVLAHSSRMSQPRIDSTHSRNEWVRRLPPQLCNRMRNRSSFLIEKRGLVCIKILWMSRMFPPDKRRV